MDDLVAKPADTPLSQQEDRLATSLVRRKLAQGSQGRLIQFKTGGQVTITTHVNLYNLSDDNSPSP